MASNFLQPGDTVTVEAPATVSSGDGVLVGLLFGIAVTDAGSGSDVPIKTTGVFRLPKVSAQAWATVGLTIYWDDGNTRCTTVDTGVPIGVNVATAANPSATGDVRLHGFVVADLYSA